MASASRKPTDLIEHQVERAAKMRMARRRARRLWYWRGGLTPSGGRCARAGAVSRVIGGDYGGWGRGGKSGGSRVSRRRHDEASEPQDDKTGAGLERRLWTCNGWCSASILADP